VATPRKTPRQNNHSHQKFFETLVQYEHRKYENLRSIEREMSPQTEYVHEICPGS
jgi:hypothetical protein